MAITSLSRDWGTSAPNIVRLVSTNTLAEVAASGYLTAQLANTTALNSGVFEWVATDNVAVTASDGNAFFVFDDGDFTTLVALAAGVGSVTLPVTSGDFAVFDGSLGAMKDSGFLPSDASKTRVVMAGSAVIVGHAAKFVDTTGTVDDTAGAMINSGNIQAGLSATAGTLISFPSTGAKGSLIVAAVANTGNTNTTISNAAMGQASVVSIPDPGGATANFALAPAALVSGNLVMASGTAGLLADSGIVATAQASVASVSLTSAQFTNMYTTPVLLVAAPGANKLIVVDRMEVLMTYVSANYASGGIVGAQYGNTAHLAGPLATNTEAAADFFAAASTAFVFNGTSGNTVGALPFSTTVDTGLYISNQTGVWTTGDSTFVVKVYYRVVATA